MNINGIETTKSFREYLLGARKVRAETDRIVDDLREIAFDTYRRLGEYLASIPAIYHEIGHWKDMAAIAASLEKVASDDTAPNLRFNTPATGRSTPPAAAGG